MNWENLPEELRARPQWVLASAMDVAPYYRNAAGGTEIASVTDPATWMKFEEACYYAREYGMCVGFVITKDDEYACIDTDNKLSNPAHPDALKWFWEQALKLDSYTEVSPSGRGLHTWIKAEFPNGVKRHPFEAYPHSRYIRCTGWAVINSPIREAQEFADWFVAKLDVSHTADAEPLVEVPEERTDGQVLEIGANADNSEKFKALYEGRWEALGYPSQSEADFALLSMFAFYSVSNEQCRRLFRSSALARKKTNRNNYHIDRALRALRARQEDEKIDMIDVGPLLAKAREAPAPERIEGDVQIAERLVIPDLEGELPWPPGVVGQVARAIYCMAPRPVKEVAIVAALGLISGMCGKAWHIPGSGINLYITLVARSAVGKEAMHSGINTIVDAVSRKFNGMQNFVSNADFASGPALVKFCNDNPSFVNVCSEWGRKLKRLSGHDGHDPAMAGLRTVMLSLYQKSGPKAIAGGISYSNKDTTVDSMRGIAYSMIGETTPKTFYSALTESMMEDGFLSRFSIVEYTGERPPRNLKPLDEPDAALVDYLAQIASHASDSISRQHSTLIGATPDVQDLMSAFENECDYNINKANEDESRRQMHNRAALKAHRVAAVLATPQNYTYPVITETEYKWALDFVRRDIRIMGGKIDSGDVGQDDNSREQKIVNILASYRDKGVADGYKVPKELQAKHIVPHNYILIRCSQLSCFTTHKLGGKEGIRQTLKSMIEAGYIKEALPKSMENAGFSGKAYLIINLPTRQS